MTDPDDPSITNTTNPYVPHEIGCQIQDRLVFALPLLGPTACAHQDQMHVVAGYAVAALVSLALHVRPILLDDGQPQPNRRCMQAVLYGLSEAVHVTVSDRPGLTETDNEQSRVQLDYAALTAFFDAAQVGDHATALRVVDAVWPPHDADPHEVGAPTFLGANVLINLAMADHNNEGWSADDPG